MGHSAPLSPPSTPAECVDTYYYPSMLPPYTDALGVYIPTLMNMPATYDFPVSPTPSWSAWLPQASSSTLWPEVMGLEPERHQVEMHMCDMASLYAPTWDEFATNMTSMTDTVSSASSSPPAFDPVQNQVYHYAAYKTGLATPVWSNTKRHPRALGTGFNTDDNSRHAKSLTQVDSTKSPHKRQRHLENNATSSPRSLTPDANTASPHILTMTHVSRRRLRRSRNTKTSKFTCLVCSLELPRAHNLKKHMLIHDSDREMLHFCSFEGCSRPPFARSHDRDRHMTVHMQDKLYQCAHCAHTTSRRDSLLRYVYYVRIRLEDV
jgi:hypothetical protein